MKSLPVQIPGGVDDNIPVDAVPNAGIAVPKNCSRGFGWAVTSSLQMPDPPTLMQLRQARVNEYPSIQTSSWVAIYEDAQHHAVIARW